jgi:hypothetical protein
MSRASCPCGIKPFLLLNLWPHWEVKGQPDLAKKLFLCMFQ